MTTAYKPPVAVDGAAPSRTAPAPAPTATAVSEAAVTEDDNLSMLEIMAKAGVSGTPGMPSASSGLAPMPRNMLPQTPTPEEAEVDFLGKVIMQIPPDIQVAIERACYVIGATLALVFIAAGVAVAIEAGAVASEAPLPPAVEGIITDILEPAFTPAVLGFFASSITLGVLKLGQFSQDEVQYSED